MAFKGLEEVNVTGIESILSYPLTGDFYFYGWIFFAMWIIFVTGFFFEEKKRLGKGNMLSSLAFSSVPIIVLAAIGSSFDIVTNEILIPIIVLGSIFIFVWYVQGD